VGKGLGGEEGDGRGGGDRRLPMIGETVLPDDPNAIFPAAPAGKTGTRQLLPCSPGRSDAASGARPFDGDASSVHQGLRSMKLRGFFTSALHRQAQWPRAWGSARRRSTETSLQR